MNKSVLHREIIKRINTTAVVRAVVALFYIQQYYRGMDVSDCSQRLTKRQVTDRPVYSSSSIYIHIFRRTCDVICMNFVGSTAVQLLLLLCGRMFCCEVASYIAVL